MPSIERVGYPEVRISLTAMERLERYITLCPTEIAGLGLMRWVDGNIDIYDIVIVEQAASMASARIEVEAIAQYVEELVEKNLDPADLRVSWHSHAGFSAHWSATDERMSETFLCDNSIEILGNHNLRFTCIVNLYKPFRLKMVDVPLVCPERETLRRQTLAEIQQKVKAPR